MGGYDYLDKISGTFKVLGCIFPSPYSRAEEIDYVLDITGV